MSDNRRVNVWIAGARLRTLPAALAPVAVGTAVVARDDIVIWRALAAAGVALALQVGANYANDYSDGIRGTDDEARVGPIRLVGSGLVEPAKVKRAAFAAFAVALVLGGLLAAAVGPELLPVGLAAVVAAWFYTGGSRPYGYAGWGEVFVFVFFGLVATVGSTYVHIRSIPADSVLAGVSLGLLITSILVVNNLRDRAGDRAAGKITLAVRLGDAATRTLYTALVVVGLLAALGIAAWHAPALLVLLAVPFAIPLIRSVMGGAVGEALIEVLAGTGRLVLVVGVLLAAGLVAA